MKCDIISLDAKKVGDIELDEAIFGVDVRNDLMARYVNWQLAKRRAGTHKTKTRGEVSGTTKKAFRQKSTGRSRQGTHRATEHRGGATVFGPRPRSYERDLPKKVRRLALRSALSAKKAEGKLIVLDKADTVSAKTADLAKKLGKLGWGSTLVIDGAEVNINFALASRNIVAFDVMPARGANVYDILRRDTLVLTKDAIERLRERLK